MSQLIDTALPAPQHTQDTKSRKNLFNGSTLLVWLMGILLAMGSVWSAAEADQTNLLANPVLQPGSGSGTLPIGWTHQGWVPDGTINHSMGPCPDAYLCAAYSYGIDSADAQPYMDVFIQNTSTLWGYTNLFMGGAIDAASVDNYRIALTARVVTMTGNSSVGLGFHLYDSAGYVSETASDLSLLTQGEQRHIHYYQTGTPFGTTGRTPTSLQPRLSIYLAPGAVIQVRLKSPTMTKGLVLNSIGIDARTGKVRLLSAAPGKLLVFTAGLHGRPVMPAQAIVTLVPTKGSVKSFQHTVSSSDPNVGDAWQVTLPSNTPSNTYSIRYSLRDLATNQLIPLQAETDVVTISTADGPVYQIGSVKVDSGAGLAIGQHFHGHPGSIGGDSRGTDPILVNYHFVRSHDSGNVGGTSWWVEDTITHNPDGLFDWTEFDRWADFHAKPGQKKLLITFYGSPTWASSKPTESSPYSNTGGLSAPPQNLPSYQKMVKATVSKYRNRIFAVECWNEPSSSGTGFFTGTGTQLADICKAIYVATKSVDKTIPTICPATYELNWLLTLKTSQGELLSNYCDWVGDHPYNHTGTDPAGNAYSQNKLGDYVEHLEAKLKSLGLNKPIAVTEWGMTCEDSPSPAHPTNFHDMSSVERGDLLYQTLLKAQEKGLVALGLYSYDSEDTAKIGGGTCKYGYEGISSGDLSVGFSYDANAAAGVNKAVQDVGSPLP